MAECVAGVVAQIGKKHLGWYVWKDKPVATRKVHSEAIKPAPDDEVFALTVIGDTWRDLDAQLAQQDENDALRYATAPAN